MAKLENTNIRLILDKLLRHPLLKDLTLETVVDYTIDFMRIVGMPKMFTEKVVELEVDEYIAVLPDDFYQVNQIKLTPSSPHITDVIDANSNIQVAYVNPPIHNNKTMRSSDDTFHMYNDDNHNNGLTYKIQGGCIYTSIKKGNILLSYQAIETDEEGYPTIPDNSSFTRALELYIKKQWFTMLFDLGRINANVLQNVQQEYAWAVGDCQTEFNRLTIDELESFSNSWRRLLQTAKAHKTGFAHIGQKL